MVGIDERGREGVTPEYFGAHLHVGKHPLR
jgi:hypothetical protein